VLERLNGATETVPGPELGQQERQEQQGQRDPAGPGSHERPAAEADALRSPLPGAQQLPAPVDRPRWWLGHGSARRGSLQDDDDALLAGPSRTLSGTQLMRRPQNAWAGTAGVFTSPQFAGPRGPAQPARGAGGAAAGPRAGEARAPRMGRPRAVAPTTLEDEIGGLGAVF
jgi:hypothetical protein